MLYLFIGVAIVGLMGFILAFCAENIEAAFVAALILTIGIFGWSAIEDGDSKGKSYIKPTSNIDTVYIVTVDTLIIGE
jgi:hypothetical protein